MCPLACLAGTQPTCPPPAPPPATLQMNAYLQEERLHCQQLASALGREQQGSESRAAENARLAAIAQTSTEEVMAAREAAQAERSRAEGLAHDNAELQGKVRWGGLAVGTAGPAVGVLQCVGDGPRLGCMDPPQS